MSNNDIKIVGKILGSFVWLIGELLRGDFKKSEYARSCCRSWCCVASTASWCRPKDAVLSLVEIDVAAYGKRGGTDRALDRIEEEMSG